VKSRLYTIYWIFCGLALFNGIYQWLGITGFFLAISILLGIVRYKDTWLVTIGSSEKAHIHWEDK
jgi:hypothetical protein